MTARELITQLQSLGESNIDREVVMVDGPAFFTPYRVKILEEDSWSKYTKGKILID